LSDEPLDDPGVQTSSAAAWIVLGLKAVAGLLASIGLMPAISRCVSGEEDQADVPIPTKAERVDPCRADPSCCEPN
jgi:hypothetical protein